ncbi:ADP-ribosylation factor-like protein 16 [Ctenocephalides felis]|uniref:ADP-ribosylation factor-like protein 16 n=1 Tax=Ctenocephalides felis TaxID=7515 RepID=UPI000E6E23F4|nr:ADP-ribosylation factor-like protein 16 [Ctenocephalides felis]
MSVLCLGPSGSGKTSLLKRLQNSDSIDFTSNSIPTVGTNIYTIKKVSESSKPAKQINIREVGGSMAPIWKNYFTGVNKIMYVVDTSNLCQVTASGVLFYSILADPRLKDTKVILVLTKMDLAYRQMRNEALLMLQFNRLQKEIPQKISVIEASAMTGLGIDNIQEWLFK